jgi:hypothetical protein
VRALAAHGAGLALLVVLECTVTSLAQAVHPDPVDELRLVLRTPCRDLAVRDQAIKGCLDSLRTPQDLRRALTLADWRDRHPDTAIAAIDSANRQALAERFCQAVRQVLSSGEASARQEALDLLVDMAETTRGYGDPFVPERLVAPDVASLVRQGPPELRGPAARVLGQLHPDLAVALPALSELLQSADPSLRQAAMEGLSGLLRAVRQAVARPAVTGPAHRHHAEAAARAADVLPVAGRGLSDWHAGVRRRAAAAVQSAAACLAQLISDPLSPELLDGPESVSLRQAVEEERARLRPLVEALAARVPALAFTLREGPRDCRVQVQQALEEAACARGRWLQQQAALAAAVVAVDDPFSDGFRLAVPRLAAAVTDPDPQIRRSAIDVLDLLGPLALPAAKALTLALEDADCFVRWAAVRALNHLGPETVRRAAPQLTELLSDPDLDVRRAAAEALGRQWP